MKLLWSAAIVLACLAADASAACDESLLGNGRCDLSAVANTAECGYDGGDCCPDTCVDDGTKEFICGSYGYQCCDPASEVGDAANEEDGCPGTLLLSEDSRKQQEDLAKHLKGEALAHPPRKVQKKVRKPKAALLEEKQQSSMKAVKGEAQPARTVQKKVVKPDTALLDGKQQQDLETHLKGEALAHQPRSVDHKIKKSCNYTEAPQIKKQEGKVKPAAENTNMPPGTVGPMKNKGKTVGAKLLDQKVDKSCNSTEPPEMNNAGTGKAGEKLLAVSQRKAAPSGRGLKNKDIRAKLFNKKLEKELDQPRHTTGPPQP